MTRTHSLFGFVPYGAPELLAAGRAHLAAALVAGSILVALTFVALHPVLPLLFRSAPLVVIRQDDRGVIVDRPPVRQPPPSHPVTPRPVVKPGAWIPVPVPEPLAPIAEETAPTGATTGPDGPPAALDDARGCCLQPETLPDRGTFVVVDELPEPVARPRPAYPDLAREAGVEGLVVVHALVGREGRVIRTEVDEDHSVPLLDAAALEAARRWVFKPALTNGHPVPVWVRLPFRFRLRE